MGWIVLTVAAALAAARWLLMASPAHFTPWLPGAWFQGAAYSLTRSVLNVGCSWIFLVLAPWVLISLGRRRLHLPRKIWGTPQPDLSRAWLRRLVWVLPLAAILLGGLAAWLSPAIRAHYPLYRAAGQSAGHLLLSEGLTLALIIATELFYRGAVLFLVESYLGRVAIYLILPIYVLDHIGAPVPEVVASLAAGAFLGHLSLATRSIWPGLATHAACAVSVDVTSALMGT